MKARRFLSNYAKLSDEFPVGNSLEKSWERVWNSKMCLMKMEQFWISFSSIFFEYAYRNPFLYQKIKDRYMST